MRRRLSLTNRRDVVVVVALLVFLSSVSGLVATAVAHEPALPGFARYDVGFRQAPPVVQAAVQAGEAPAAPAQAEVAIERLPAPVMSMSIPAINIVAPLVPMGVRPDGYMDLPYSPHDIGWYEFTSKPGMGGNAVFSAHVDYINYGPAVFWNLSKVGVGDEVFVRLRDGALIQYVVGASYTIPLAQVDIEALIAPTEEESITLITCSGEFFNNNYSHRVIITATRAIVQRGS